jgi:hypothetical protein
MFGKHNPRVTLNKNNTLAVLPRASPFFAWPPASSKGQNPAQKLYNSGF